MRSIFLITLFTLTWFIGTMSLSAQELILNDTFGEKNDSTIKITTPFDRIPLTGYMPVTVKIDNKTNKARNWKLDFLSSNESYKSNPAGMRTFHDVTAKENSTATYEFLVPIQPSFQRSWLGSKDLAVESGFFQGSHSDQSSKDWPFILISKDLHTANGSRLDNVVSKKLSSRHGGTSSFGGSFDPALLLEDWRAYIGYEIIMMTDADWQICPPGSRNAIRQWIIMGGRLLIGNTLTTTKLYNLDLDIKTDADKKALGMGEVKLFKVNSTDLEVDEKKIIDDIQKNNYYHILGQSYRDDFSKKWSLQKLFGKRDFKIGLIVFAMLLFGILVGPINLFVFAKEGKRHKLFVTTPIISAAASLFFIVIILFQDGFGGKGIREAIIEIGVSGDNNTYIHQEQIARTGVLLSSKFTIEEPVFISPVSIDKSRWSRFHNDNENKHNFRLQLVDQKTELSGDWFKSRSEHAHVLATVRPSRGRVEFDLTSGFPKATSSLSYPLKNLTFRNNKGEFFQAAELPATGTVTLQKIPDTDFTNHKTEVTKNFSNRNVKRLQRLLERPNSFSAIADSAEQIDSLDSIRWSGNRSIITGTNN